MDDIDYKVQIEQFEGPLDLLLHLIRKAEIDIKDIFVSQITEQYLAYMLQLPELDMDMASDFLTIAATLIYIKSHSLLPAPPSQDDEEDPRELFIRQLSEYKAFKEISEKLRMMEDIAKGTYYKLPEEHPLPQPLLDLGNIVSENLFEAMLQVLQRVSSRAGRPAPRDIVLQGFTIPERIGYISEMLRSRPRIVFQELFESSATKMEVIVTFLALLEMIQQCKVGIEQNGHLSDLYILKL
jgi:segregation and condensation protein A